MAIQALNRIVVKRPNHAAPVTTATLDCITGHDQMLDTRQPWEETMEQQEPFLFASRKFQSRDTTFYTIRRGVRNGCDLPTD